MLFNTAGILRSPETDMGSFGASTGPERNRIQTGTSLQELRPHLIRSQKIIAIDALKSLFTDPEFQNECARVCKEAGSKFRLKDLQGELVKAGGIFDHYLNEARAGLHDYARANGSTVEVQRPYGRIVGFTAPNYPIGENAAVMGVLNAVLAGCPIDLRLGAGSSSQIDEFMADAVIKKLENIVPKGFIGKVAISHSNSKQVLANYAGVFFIGGSTGLELLKHTKYQIGNLQTGRPNWMIVRSGQEENAAKILGSAVASRFGLSCSATSVVFTEGNADSLVSLLKTKGAAVKEELIAASESSIPDDRFAKSLREARDICVKAGGKCETNDDDYLTIVRISKENFEVLRKANLVPEFFGPGFLIIENISIPENPSAEDFGDLGLLSAAKTGIIITANDDDSAKLATACIDLAARVSVAHSSSTPAPGVGYVHCNVDGHPAEMRHIVDPTALLRAKSVIINGQMSDADRPFWD